LRSAGERAAKGHHGGGRRLGAPQRAPAVPRGSGRERPRTRTVLATLAPAQLAALERKIAKKRKIRKEFLSSTTRTAGRAVEALLERFAILRAS